MVNKSFPLVEAYYLKQTHSVEHKIRTFSVALFALLVLYYIVHNQIPDRTFLLLGVYLSVVDRCILNSAIPIAKVEELPVDNYVLF